MSDNLQRHDPQGILKEANRAGISVTVDCQCPGIFINDKQCCAADGSGLLSQFPMGIPNVPAEFLTALAGEVNHLEQLLRAAGRWSCGCELARIEEDDGADRPEN
jgi:hypothetical protein